jgi:hypothetical protein
MSRLILDIVIRLRSINQRAVRGENDGNFATQRDLLEGGTINQMGKKSANRAKEAPRIAT